MAVKHIEKNGEIVRIDANDLAKYTAQGWTEYDPSTQERDPRDLEGGVLNLAKGTLTLPVKASPPAGPNKVGEVYMATGGVLKACTVAGSPGTWVSVGAQT